jgi:putative peptidoglycan lipid II flippase
VAVLYFAYRLIQFPLGIFSNALSQALLPTLSTQALEEDRGKLIQTLCFGLRSAFFLLVPASVGFMVLSRPIIRTLFQGGKFGPEACLVTANALLFYSLGLFAYGASKILQSCFFALKDTVTPAKVSAVALGLNIILNSVLMFPLKIAGLALATSISGIVSFFILLAVLKKKLAPLNFSCLFLPVLKILAASLAMGGVCFLLAQTNPVADSSILARVVNLGLPVLCGLISYIIFCFLC